MKEEVKCGRFDGADKTRAALAMNVLAKCPDTKLVLSGYRYIMMMILN